MLTPDAYPPAGRLHRAADRAAAPGRGRGRLRPAGRGPRLRPARAGRPRVQLPAREPYPQRRRLAALRQLSPLLLECLCRLVERGPRRDRRLQADPGLGGDDRGGGAAGAGRAGRLRRRGRWSSTPIATTLAGAFRRQFDIGYSRRLYDWLLLAGEGDEPARATVRRRGAATRLPRGPAELPGILARSPPAGSAIVPVWPGTVCRAALARRLSGQDYFWTSDVDRRPAAALWRRCEPRDAAGVPHQQPVPAARGHRRGIFSRWRADSRPAATG